jgi:hypothetical protein
VTAFTDELPTQFRIVVTTMDGVEHRSVVLTPAASVPPVPELEALMIATLQTDAVPMFDIDGTGKTWFRAGDVRRIAIVPDP